MTLLAREGRVLAATVTALHATTKQPVRVTARFKTDPPKGWALRIANGVVVLTRPRRPEDDVRPPVAPPPLPAPPVVLTVTATDPALVLARREADVTLDEVAKKHAFDPADTTVEVVLVKRKDRTPSTGRTVTVLPRTGTAVKLTETPPASGVYRATRTWDAEFHPLDVRVGNTAVRSVSYDPTSPVQRIRLVDPT